MDSHSAIDRARIEALIAKLSEYKDTSEARANREHQGRHWREAYGRACEAAVLGVCIAELKTILASSSVSGEQAAPVVSPRAEVPSNEKGGWEDSGKGHLLADSLGAAEAKLEATQADLLKRCKAIDSLRAKLEVAEQTLQLIATDEKLSVRSMRLMAGDALAPANDREERMWELIEECRVQRHSLSGEPATLEPKL